MSKTNLALCGGLLGLILLLAVNAIANAQMRSTRLDLTEERLYTLSDGSTRIVERVDEPIRLTLYSSKDIATKMASVQRYATRVRELLEEFALRSDGKIALEIVDPEPFSEEEERAASEGVQGVPLPSGESLFLGLSGTNSVGDTEVIPFFDPGKEAFLEYDVAKLVHSLTHLDKGVVGILSSLPVEGGAPSPMAPRGGQRWQIVDEVSELFETRFLQPTVDEIPADVEVLVLIHPKGLSEATLFAIDQYVLRGGNALVFVDPHCEADQAGADPSDPLAAMERSKRSDLPRLFKAWGIELVPGKFAGDRQNALPVPIGSGQRRQQIDFVGYVELAPEYLDQDDPVSSQLQMVRFGMPGALRQVPGATTTFTPLAHTSEDSMLIDVSQLQYAPQPEELLRNFVPEMQELTLVARVHGAAQSAFPDGSPVELPADEADAAPEAAEGEAAGAQDASLAEGQINVIVFADCDLLTDRFWVSKQSFGGATLVSKTADNGDFLLNCVENMAGGDDLIGIRAGGKYSRPFEKVDDLRREAETRYLTEKRELEAKQQQIQGQINEIIRSATPGSELILTPEQEEELRRKQEEEHEIRRRLRDVEFDLRKDIERLGTRVKLANILLVPALVAVAALGLGLFRGQRAKSHRRQS